MQNSDKGAIRLAIGTGLFLGFSLLILPASPAAEELLRPFRVEAGGSPIDVTIGHAAPLVTDLDGDGNPDLLFTENETQIAKDCSEPKTFLAL